MNDDTQANGLGISARRRLIRGAFAAPAALALPSGSALAAQSLRHCVMNQVGSPQYPLPSPTADSFVRVQLQVFSATGTSTSQGKSGMTVTTIYSSTWVKGADIVALQAPGQTAFLTSTQWRCVAVSSPSCYAINATRTSLPIEGTCGGDDHLSGTTQTAGPYAAILVDASGNIVNVEMSGTPAGQSAVYQSCWMSFKLG